IITSSSSKIGTFSNGASATGSAASAASISPLRSAVASVCELPVRSSSVTAGWRCRYSFIGSGSPTQPVLSMAPPPTTPPRRLARVVCEVDEAVGVVEQDLARWRQMQPLAIADEERDAEVGFELAHARRDV